MTAVIVLAAVTAVFVVLTVDSWFNPPRIYVPHARHYDPAGWSTTGPPFPAWLYNPVDRTAGTSFNTGEWCAIGDQPDPQSRLRMPWLLPWPDTDGLARDWPQPPALPPTMPHDWPGLHVDVVSVAAGDGQ